MARQRLTIDEAEALSLKALGFLASDADRLTRFLQLTGLSPEDLRSQVGEATTLTAVLDHLLSDQSLLLVFAAECGIEPQLIEEARARVSGVDNPGVWS